MPVYRSSKGRNNWKNPRKWLVPICILLGCALTVGLFAAFMPKEDVETGSGPSLSVSVSMPVSSMESIIVSSLSQPEESVSEAPSSSSIPPQAAPTFIDNTPAVGEGGTQINVTFKTDVESTVNAIVATSGEIIGTKTFYDYVKRGISYPHAVSSKTTYNVTSAGKTETYNLPNLSKNYYLLVNAAENLTGTWQSSVLVIPLHNPASYRPLVSIGTGSTAASSNAVEFTVTADMPVNVYALVAAKDAPAPTAQQIRDGGTGYGSTVFWKLATKTADDKQPYSVTLTVPLAGFGKGDYILYVAGQNPQNSESGLSALHWRNFSV